MTNLTELNEALANDLKDFIMNNNLACDVRIYFNNKCYDWCDGKVYFKEPNILEDIVASNYFEYADDETVSMSFEGTLYEILNYAETKRDRELASEFYNVFTKHGCYYELGHSWNLAVCYL
jgi:hypothetical protein